MQKQPGLVRAIGRWSLLALVVNSVVGSGVFGLPGTVAGLLGKRSTLAVLIAGLAIGVVVACFAEVSSYFTETGGPYLYARTAFGRLTSILVGWTFYLSQAAAPAANSNLFVTYLAEFWPRANDPTIRFELLAVLIAILTIINLIGVRQGTQASNVFTVAKILPILMVVAAGAAIAVVRPAPVLLQPVLSAQVWLQAMFPLFFLFGGFEAALAPAGEAKDPQRDNAFALIGGLLVCIAIFGLVQWVVVGVLGSGAALSERPLADVARFAMGQHGAQLVSVGAMLSVYGYLSAKLLGIPRITFAMAEGGDLPRVFALISRRFQTPWFSIAVYALTVWALAEAGNYVWNVTLSVFARLFYYGVTCAALLALRRRSSKKARFRMPGGPILAVLGVVICFALLKAADFSQWRIVVAAYAAAVANWAWVYFRDKKTKAATG